MRRQSVFLAVAIFAAACSRAGSDDRAFEWTTELPAGSVVHLRSGVGRIDVHRATGQNAMINGSSHWVRGRSSDVHFVVNHDGNDYYVCAMWRNSGSCGEKGYRGRNTGGFLTMFSLFHRTTDASADLRAEVPANVAVDAKTLSGSVEVDGITAGVIARTANGTVQASNVAGPLTLVTTNGDVRLSADALAANDSIHLTTTNGTIRAELPPNTEGRFDLSVVNGNVKSDFPLAAAAKGKIGRHLQGQIGSSQRIVKMHSVNGSVVVVSRGSAEQH